MLIELSPLGNSPDPLLREVTVKFLARFVLDEEDNRTNLENHDNEEPMEPTLLNRSLSTILRSPIQYGVSQEHVELSASQLIEIVDCQLLGTAQADSVDFSLLPEVGGALIACLSTARSPSKILLPSTIPITCATGFSSVGCTPLTPSTYYPRQTS